MREGDFVSKHCRVCVFEVRSSVYNHSLSLHQAQQETPHVHNLWRRKQGKHCEQMGVSTLIRAMEHAGVCFLHAEHN